MNYWQMLNMPFIKMVVRVNNYSQVDVVWFSCQHNGFLVPESCSQVVTISSRHLHVNNPARERVLYSGVGARIILKTK